MGSVERNDVVNRPRVLVTWGTKRGGTAGIARIIGDTLRSDGLDVDVAPVSTVLNASAYDAVVIGGALYANRWHADACTFINRNVAALRRIPVWMFSSGPLDDSADNKNIPPPTHVAVLSERIGAQGHVTFGGRLTPDAQGFPASAMAKTKSGDWRNPERIRVWAHEVARAIPNARPGVAIDHPGWSLGRLMTHAIVGWVLWATVRGSLLRIPSAGTAIARHAIFAPLAFMAIAAHYFNARGAREPIPTALAFAFGVLVMDVAFVAGLIPRQFAMFTSFPGTWLAIALIFLGTWLVGFLMSTMPWPETLPKNEQSRHGSKIAGDHDSRISLDAR